MSESGSTPVTWATLQAVIEGFDSRLKAIEQTLRMRPGLVRETFDSTDEFRSHEQ